jgi:predicted thioesterase
MVGFMIEPGRNAAVTLVVGEADTAIAHGSGDVLVLATPRILALAEQAAVAALGEDLTPEMTSVGVHAELHHVKATNVGAVVAASAEVIVVRGRKISFEFQVVEDGKVVAYGTHRRAIVRREDFQS